MINCFAMFYNVVCLSLLPFDFSIGYLIAALSSFASTSLWISMPTRSAYSNRNIMISANSSFASCVCARAWDSSCDLRRKCSCSSPASIAMAVARSLGLWNCFRSLASLKARTASMMDCMYIMVNGKLSMMNLVLR